MGERLFALENLVIAGDFWSGKRVFITGHTGFKGSWLALWLDSLGAIVSGYALTPPTKPSLWEQLTLSSRFRGATADVCDRAQLLAALSEFQPEIVFHLAAQSLVRVSYDDPVATYSTNIMGTVNLLDAARQVKGVRAIVNVTSDKCYENQEQAHGYRETDPMGGHDPYSSSKGCAELITAAWRKSFFPASRYDEHGIALASARAGNVIGGGDWARDRLVPDMMRGALEGRPARLRNPDAARPWQHVLDPLHGYLVLAEKLWSGPGFAGGWNFGPAEEDVVSVGKLADMLISRWGAGSRWTADPGQHPHEANYLKLDCTKARASLDWRPMLALPKALDWTVEWYRAYARRSDTQAVCLEQIGEFQGLAAA